MAPDPSRPVTLDAELRAFVALQAGLERHGQHKGFVYQGVCDFLQQHGESWTVADLPADIAPMPARQCFWNAGLLAFERDDLRYVEGYAFRIVPAHHAWCVDRDGRVVDPTWATIDDLIAEKWGEPTARAYFGTVFDRDTLRHARRKKDCISVLANWTNDFALFRAPFRSVAA